MTHRRAHAGVTHEQPCYTCSVKAGEEDGCLSKNQEITLELKSGRLSSCVNNRQLEDSVSTGLVPTAALKGPQPTAPEGGEVPALPRGSLPGQSF